MLKTQIKGNLKVLLLVEFHNFQTTFSKHNVLRPLSFQK